MGRSVQFVVLNNDAQFGRELRAALLKHQGVKIVAEVDEPAFLRQAAGQFNADILLVNLDPAPDVVLPIAGEIARERPELAVFAVSAATDSQLLLNVLRMGLREFLPRPVDENALGEAIERVASQRVETVSRGKLITVSGSSGGIGTTTVAINLAVELANLCSGRVTVVDLDYRFGQVATLLDVEATYTLADLCHSPEQLEQQVIERALIKHSSGVRVLSRPGQLAQADTITASACVGLLSALVQFNDYVITDGPSRFDAGGQSVFDFSDINLLMVQLLVPSVRNALRIIAHMRESGANLERTRLICNRMGRDSAALSVADVRQTLGIDEFAVLPDDWPTVSGSINLGEPLATFGPKSKIRLAIRDIAERLHSPAEEADVNEEHKKSLIGRIFAGA